MDVLLVNDLLFRHVDAGIELGKDFQCGGADLQRDCGYCHFPAGFFGSGCEARPQLLKLSDVGFIVLSDVRNAAPRFPQVLGRFSPDTSHRDALDVAPLREIWKRRLGHVCARHLCRSAD